MSDSEEIIQKYKSAPCSVCGKVTEKFVLFGNSPEFYLLGGEIDPEKQTIIKLCESCSAYRWVANYRRG